MMTGATCAKCFHTWEHYQQRALVPPCPRCGYPEAKTADEYYRSMGVRPEKQDAQDQGQ